jgi:hypothetical protein
MTHLWSVILLTAVLAAEGSGQATKPASSAPAKAEKVKPEAAILAEQLADSDAAVQNKAYARIREILDAPIEYNREGVAVLNVDPRWVRGLIAAGRYADAEQLAVEGILRAPSNSMGVSTLQKYRLEAFIAAKNNEKALTAAKAFYNVCTLPQSAIAVDQVSLCLARSNPDDRGIAQRFKAQQVALATTRPAESTSATTQPADQNLIKRLSIDATPFEPTLQRLTAQDYRTLLGRGNLLLLCDRGAEARQCFEKAIGLATAPKQLTAAMDGVARAIRAEHGAIGPANAYILAQRGEVP